jgi:hypothetical protein
MNNYPTPMNTLGSFAICMLLGAGMLKLYQWASTKEQRAQTKAQATV